MSSEASTRLWFRRKDLLLFAIFIALFLAVFHDFFFTSRVFYERDTTIIEIPARKLTINLLRQSNFALWTDAYGNGQPFLANPKNAVLYPATLLYLILPFFTAFKLYYLVHVLIGWLGLYILCRSYAVSERGSFLAATLFSFSGMYLSSFEFYNHIAALAWLPWVLFVLHRDWKRPLVRYALLSVLWALMIIAGAPEVVILAAILALGQAFFVPRKWKRKVAATAVTLGLGCLLAAAQILPSLELLSRTERPAQVGNWSFELVQLVNLPFPNILGNDRQPGHSDYWGWHLFDKDFPLYYSLYMGFGALLLAFFALRRPLARPRLALIILAGGLFLLSCGSYSPIFFIQRHIPILSAIRYPVKFFLGSVFCLVILAGMGFDDLTGSRPPGRRGVRILALSALVGSAVFWTFKGEILRTLNRLFIIDRESSLNELGRSIATGLFVLALTAVIIYFLFNFPGRRKALGVALIALAAIDPAYHNRFVNPTVDESFFDQSALLAKLSPPLTIYRSEILTPFFKQTLGDNRRLLRYMRGSLYPFTAMGDGVRYVFNRDAYGTYSADFRGLMEAVSGLPPEQQAKVLNYLGCAYHIGEHALYNKTGSDQVEIEGLSISIEPLFPAPQTAFFSTSIRRADSLAQKIALFSESDFDPRQNVIVDSDLSIPAGSITPDEMQAAITPLSVETGRGSYRIDAKYGGVAVFPGNYERGWRAWVDGEEVSVFQVNLFSKGIVVPPGQHQIILRFLPWSFVIGVAGSFATAVILLGVILQALGWQEKKKGGDNAAL